MKRSVARHELEWVTGLLPRAAQTPRPIGPSRQLFTPRPRPALLAAPPLGEASSLPCAAAFFRPGQAPAGQIRRVCRAPPWRRPACARRAAELLGAAAARATRFRARVPWSPV